MGFIYEVLSDTRQRRAYSRRPQDFTFPGDAPQQPPREPREREDIWEEPDNGPWFDTEDRSKPPEKAPAGIEWQGRCEIIDVESITSFCMQRAARCADMREGPPIFVALNFLLRRCVEIEGIGHCIRVVLWSKEAHEGKRRRRYSGMNPWPTMPDDGELCDWMDSEVRRGVPRSHAGRSAFSYSSLVKTVARAGLGKYLPVDVDMILGHIQLRARRDGAFPMHA